MVHMNRLARRLAAALAAVACASLAIAATAGASHGTCAVQSPQIWDTVATDVYWDFGDRPDLELGKFVVTFAQPPDSFCATSIESAFVTGPDGYRFELDPTEPLDLENLNGYVDDHFIHAVWLMGFDRRGFLREGDYTITVRFKDGVVRRQVNRFSPRRDLLDAYLQRRDAISFSPSGALVRATSPDPLRWTTMAELGGPSAYYSVRLSRPLDGFLDPHNLIFWDAIFYQSYLRPDAGLDNGTQSLAPLMIHPNKRYAWFVEILDSNRLQDLNMAIFQPAQFFKGY